MSCKRGADPPKNSAGRTGTFPSSDWMMSLVSMGNGSCITVVNFSNCEPVTSSQTSHTRSTCLSAVTMLSSPDAMLPFQRSEANSTKMGRAGQIPRFLPTRLLFVQRIRRSRHSGDANTTCHHFRHTCTSKSHFHFRR